MSALPEEAPADTGEQRLSPAILEILPGQDETSREKWLFSPVFVRLLATNAAFGFSVSTFYLLPKHLAVSFAASPAQIGLVTGIFSLAALFSVPFLGLIVERLGHRRASIAGYLLMAACAFAFALVNGIGPGLWTLRVLQGLAASIVFAASVALVSAVAPPDKLGQAMGLSGAASLAMSAVAPAIAESLGARYGFGYAFALAGVAALLGAMASRGLPKLEMAFGPHARSLLAIPGPDIRAVLAALAVTGAGFNVVMAFLAPFALRHGIQAVRGFFISYTVAALTIRVLGGGLTDRLGLRRTARLGITLYGIVIAGIGLAGPAHMVSLGFVFGLAHGALFPALMALLFKDVEPRDRTWLAGLSNGVLQLGMLSVSLFGALANHTGFELVFILVGALVAAASVLLMTAALRRLAALGRGRSLSTEMLFPPR
jgi:MFS family permease